MNAVTALDTVLGAPRAVLVRAPNWVGDAILAVPALCALREAFPGAHLAVLAVPWVADVFRFVPAVDEIVLFDRKGRHRGLRGLWRLGRELATRRFDVAITQPRSASSAILLGLTGIPTRVGYDGALQRPWLTHPVPFPGKGRPGIHERELHLELLRGTGIPAPRSDPRLVTPAHVADAAARALEASGIAGKPYVAIAPGAAFGGAKRWTATGFAAVADRAYRETGLEAVLLGSPGERPIARAVNAAARRAPVDLCGRIGLAEALAVIGGARLLVTNDSGLMHAGAALGVPLVAVFGPTDAEATGPVGPSTSVVSEPVACAPCFLRDCPIDHRCMERIAPERVWSAAQSLAF